jgi:hypothetical protein
MEDTSSGDMSVTISTYGDLLYVCPCGSGVLTPVVHALEHSGISCKCGNQVKVDQALVNRHLAEKEKGM